MSTYKSNIWKLYLMKLFYSFHFIGGVLMPFFTIWGGLSYFQVTILQAWFVLSLTLLEVPTGAIADKFGRKISVALGLIVIIFGAFVYSIYPNFYIFMLGEFLWALSAALISGADQALLYDTLKELKQEKKSKKILARYSSFMLLGIAVAAPIGSWIGATYGLQYAVRAMMIPFFISAIIAFTIKEPHYKQEKESQRYIKVLTAGVKHFYKNKILRILAFDYVLVMAFSFFIVWMYQPLLLSLGYPLILLGLIHSISGVAEILVMNNFEKFEKIVGSKRKYIFYSAFMIGIAFMILSISNNMWITVFLSVFIFGFGFTRKTLFHHYMNKFIESGNRATVLSSISMLENFARAVTYPLIGLIMEYSLNIAALILGLIIIIISVFSKVEEHHLID